jgi:tRNA-uridine 2-sulfurtransferase
MSGGVDSSVSAALLKHAGYHVVGVFMRLGSPGDTLDTLQEDSDNATCRISPTTGKPLKLGHQGCCSVSDAADARLVAAQLDIPFYVVNFKKDFGRIMDYFAQEYAQGRTPNPCVRCNDWLKFGKLHDYAKQIDADLVASGHYAQIKQGPNGTPALFSGLDQDKDQSYVLFGVPRAQLSSMMLPVGGLRKSHVRELAEHFKLPVFNKPDSQEICFIPDNDYASFVAKRRPELAVQGDILDESGQVLGTHTGQHQFTIGQRRGLGISGSIPLFVIDKDPAKNTIRVGPRERLFTKHCLAAEANWLVDDLSTSAWRTGHVKVRSKSRAVGARFRLLSTSHQHVNPETPSYSGRAGHFEVTFDEPLEAVTPGQALVIYDNQTPGLVLGGGWISSVTQDTSTLLTQEALHE